VTVVLDIVIAAAAFYCGLSLGYDRGCHSERKHWLAFIRRTYWGRR
jgi:hypothetical protein